MKGKIDHIGMWTWGGRIYNWKRYLDNMQKVGMDSVVMWHTDKAPHNAAEIQEYAHARGISVIWGFNWSWNSPVCLNNEEDAAHWRDIVMSLIENYYAPLNPDGICFQVGGTEFDSRCRLDCDVCKVEYARGAGRLFVKFAGSIMNAVQSKYPGLKIYANVHLGGLHKSYEDLKVIDPSITIMWEDLPGPAKRIQVPFAYDWSTDEARLTSETIEMAKRMCELRGDDEDVAFVIKGFPCRWGGEDPCLLDELELSLLSKESEKLWNDATDYCERHLDEALKIFRIIADSPARSKMALLLVEFGLWEYKMRYPALLINEALRNPYRDPSEVVKATSEYLASLE